MSGAKQVQVKTAGQRVFSAIQARNPFASEQTRVNNALAMAQWHAKRADEIRAKDPREILPAKWKRIPGTNCKTPHFDREAAEIKQARLIEHHTNKRDAYYKLAGTTDIAEARQNP